MVQGYLERTKESSNLASNRNRSIVIDMLVDPRSAKDHSILTPQQLNDEVIMLLTAGNDTTSNAMIIGIYQICRNEDVYSRLYAELKENFPSVDHIISLEEAKRLPFLVSVSIQVLIGLIC